MSHVYSSCIRLRLIFPLFLVFFSSYAFWKVKRRLQLKTLLIILPTVIKNHNGPTTVSVACSGAEIRTLEIWIVILFKLWTLSILCTMIFYVTHGQTPSRRCFYIDAIIRSVHNWKSQLKFRWSQLSINHWLKTIFRHKIWLISQGLSCFFYFYFFILLKQ